MIYIFVTIFPNLIEPYFKDSILSRAIKDGLIDVKFYNPRDYATNKHKKVDDKLCGGGAGQLMTVQPLFDCLDDIIATYDSCHILFLSACGKKYVQNDAKRLATKETIVFVSSRYEGVDERVLERYAAEVFSIGSYVLTGGELPSLVLADSIARNINGVLGNDLSLKEESYNTDNMLEAPAFAKPLKYKGQSVIYGYISGDHQNIKNIKNQLSRQKTDYFSPEQ
ncbi:MAG: tRNA (guanosine(37)-N1)-methyltransferase TrmD [Epsilonproteobacteria bacterium]|nr:MAG: tRNA (guanosine(37)-N1)-methyltransferase TrmD [Campylobacterota bacterium]